MAKESLASPADSPKLKGPTTTTKAYPGSHDLAKKAGKCDIEGPAKGVGYNAKK